MQPPTPKTTDFVYKTLAVTAGSVLVLFAISVFRIMWMDGNSQLVTNVSNNVMTVLVTSIGGIVAALLGEKVATALASRPQQATGHATNPTTVTTATTITTPSQTQGTQATETKPKTEEAPPHE